MDRLGPEPFNNGLYHYYDAGFTDSYVWDNVNQHIRKNCKSVKVNGGGKGRIGATLATRRFPGGVFYRRTHHRSEPPEGQHCIVHYRNVIEEEEDDQGNQEEEEGEGDQDNGQETETETDESVDDMVGDPDYIPELVERKEIDKDDDLFEAIDKLIAQGINAGDVKKLQDREECNREDFPVEYKDAMFFIIKSYGEDDVHKSIKYNVWASTPNGNKRLDAAYQEVQQNSGGCPVFLFFSVNGSGQFVGLWEMIGPVDFNKNVECWQQDKWTGFFPLKWRIVKDVPNNLLKHTKLENNENKPVTNSRDTQEVKLEQGLKVMKNFKEHNSKTCILDDFLFYEVRQKTILEKKAKQQQSQKQVWEGRTNDEKTGIVVVI